MYVNHAKSKIKVLSGVEVRVIYMQAVAKVLVTKITK